MDATFTIAVSEQAQLVPFPQLRKQFQAPEVQSPSTHALPHAESPHPDIPLPLPIAKVNPKFTELPSSEIDRTKLKTITDHRCFAEIPYGP